ncbi:MAG: MEDS domain-containing protein, partial [Solirubrobacteraceae bacterium]
MAIRTGRDIGVGPGEHAVVFYEHDAGLAATVGGYLADALRDGAVAIVVATGAHRRAFEAELAAAGIDTADACQDGALILLDAAELLAQLMPAGRVQRAAFRRVIGGVVRKGTESGRPVRVYGEMVALLWEAGALLDV